MVGWLAGSKRLFLTWLACVAGVSAIIGVMYLTPLPVTPEVNWPISLSYGLLPLIFMAIIRKPVIVLALVFVWLGWLTNGLFRLDFETWKFNDYNLEAGIAVYFSQACVIYALWMIRPKMSALRNMFILSLAMACFGVAIGFITQDWMLNSQEHNGWMLASNLIFLLLIASASGSKRNAPKIETGSRQQQELQEAA